MATRSFIARQTEAGYEGVYCHWDGYPEGVGAVLQEHYRDPNKIAELLSHGDISILRETVGTKHSFDDRNVEETTYYGRDRGETGSVNRPFKFVLLPTGLKRAESIGCEFFYLFTHRRWFVCGRSPQYFGMSDGTSFKEIRLLDELLVENAESPS